MLITGVGSDSGRRVLLHHICPPGVAKSVNSVSSSKYVCLQRAGDESSPSPRRATVVCLGINEAALDT